MVEVKHSPKKCRICFQTEEYTGVHTVQSGVKQRGVNLSKTQLIQSKSLKGSLSTDLSSNSLAEKIIKHTKGIPNFKSEEFISPCKCKGSMAWVHRGCLREWRLKSPRKDSFIRCEQCFTLYHFEHNQMSVFLTHPFASKLLTVIIFLFSLATSICLGILLLHLTQSSFEEFQSYQSSSGRRILFQPHHEGSEIWEVNKIRYENYVPFMIPTEPATDYSDHGQILNVNFLSTLTEDGVKSKITDDPKACIQNSLGKCDRKSDELYEGAILDDVTKSDGSRVYGNSLFNVTDIAIFFNSLIDTVHYYFQTEGFTIILPLAIAILAELALLSDGSHINYILGMALLFATMALYLVDWPWAVWMYPFPAAFGLVHFVREIGAFSEQLLGRAVKYSFVEVLNYPNNYEQVKFSGGS